MIEYLGHSAFYIQTQKAKILIDPFILPPLTPFNQEVSDIFVTHGHGDHIGDAINISKTKGAQITTMFELANYCNAQGAKALGVNLGGKINYPWGEAVFVHAEHSSSAPDGSYGGVAAGVVLNIDGFTIYHAGDTAVFSDMKLIKELYKPDVAMLPVGGFYTMGVQEALLAAEFIGAKMVIPMHYNTFDAIKADVEAFKTGVVKLGSKCVIMSSGEKIEL